MNMKTLRLCLFGLILSTTGLAYTDPSGQMVRNFAPASGGVIQLLTKLAQHVRVVIGISGELAGFESKQISIVEDNRTLKQVLDEICGNDPRFSWMVLTDGSINVAIGPVKRLSVLDLKIRHVSFSDTPWLQLFENLAHQPEIQSWQRSSKCKLLEVVAINGSLQLSRRRVNAEIHDKPLWKVLNILAIQGEGYSWRALKLSQNPCTIDLEVPEGPDR